MLNNKRLIFILFSVSVLAFSSVVSSAVSSGAFSAQQLEKQRALFVTVDKSLKKNKNDLYRKYRADLQGYPLTPYLEALALINRFDKVRQADLDLFVASNKTLPQAGQIKYQWLNHLASNKRWQDYIRYFDQINASGNRYQCLKGIAFLKLGKKSQAWQQARQLWLTGSSQNKACDPLFSEWKSAGQLTQNLASQRFWLAVEKNNLSLARYIDRRIKDNSYKRATELFWQIHQKPYQLAKNTLDGSKPRHRIIMIHGIKRLTSRNLNKAVDIWLGYRNQYPFTAKQISVMDQRLALRMAKGFKDYAADQIMRIDPYFQYPRITEWRIRLALSEQNWGVVQTLISQLPADVQDDSRWLYWSTVASLRNAAENLRPGVKPPLSINQKPLVQLSKERNFYAFLIADINNQPFQLNHQSGNINQPDLDQLVRDFSGFARIREWVYHQRFYKAQSELNKIKPLLSSRQRKLVPYLAQQWNWHHQAIMTAAQEALWDDLELRFPSPQAQIFSRNAEQQKLDYTWVMAIARQESAFNPQARSHSGAMGLMQLMPGTARQTAKQSQINYRRTTELYRPELNIALGTAHLARLINRFDHSLIFATAAYNAGSSPVKRWLKARGHLPLDIWIETIPYDETRLYVQNVMAFRVIYGNRDNRPIRMLSPREASSLTLGSEYEKPAGLSPL